MATGLANLGEQIWLRQMICSGRALELVKAAGLSTAAVGEIIGCAQPNAWRVLHGRQFPRHATALKLADLLKQLLVIHRASEDIGKVLRP